VEWRLISSCRSESGRGAISLLVAEAKWKGVGDSPALNTLLSSPSHIVVELSVSSSTCYLESHSWCHCPILSCCNHKPLVDLYRLQTGHQGKAQRREGLERGDENSQRQADCTSQFSWAKAMFVVFKCMWQKYMAFDIGSRYMFLNLLGWQNNSCSPFYLYKQRRCLTFELESLVTVSTNN
jgi:hypothetical protein